MIIGGPMFRPIY